MTTRDESDVTNLFGAGLALIGIPVLLSGVFAVVFGVYVVRFGGAVALELDLLGIAITTWGVASLVLGWRLFRFRHDRLSSYNLIWALSAGALALVWFILKPSVDFPSQLFLVGALVSALIALLGRAAA